jgi:hypothetical protein
VNIIEILMRIPALVALIDRLAHLWIIYRYEQRKEYREKHVDQLKEAKTDDERMEIVKRIADSFKFSV